MIPPGLFKRDFWCAPVADLSDEDRDSDLLTCSAMWFKDEYWVPAPGYLMSGVGRLVLFSDITKAQQELDRHDRACGSEDDSYPRRGDTDV